MKQFLIALMLLPLVGNYCDGQTDSFDLSVHKHANGVVTEVGYDATYHFQMPTFDFDQSRLVIDQKLTTKAFVMVGTTLVEYNVVTYLPLHKTQWVVAETGTESWNGGVGEVPVPLPEVTIRARAEGKAPDDSTTWRLIGEKTVTVPTPPGGGGGPPIGGDGD